MPFSYLAGIIDGEGCISIHKQLGTRQLRKRHILYIHIANTDEKLMQYLLNKVGGNVSRRQVKKKWKISRVWRIGDNKAKELLKQVYPYLILKRKQAKIGFELRETYNNNERFTEKDNHATGAMYVQDLSGASGTTNVSVVNGTINRLHDAGTLGSIANVGVIHI